MAICPIAAQPLTFLDAELESYILHENSMDTNGDDLADAMVDTDGDGSIDQAEALAVTDLMIRDLSDGYEIRSVEDLAQFSNLRSLALLHNDSLHEVSGLGGLDSLQELWIGSNFWLYEVDLSDLPPLVALRIEDEGRLRYLNVQNGSYPSAYFSLFYTEQIEYACVDDIPEEIAAMNGHMAEGGVVSTDCVGQPTGLTADPIPDVDMSWQGGVLYVSSSLVLDGLRIYDMLGRNTLRRSGSGRTWQLPLDASGPHVLEILQAGTVQRHIILQR